MLVGRSMRKNVNIGRSLGHINAPEGIFVQPREIDQFPDEKLVIISTGSQGEPLSALRRMAYRDHPAVELRERRHGDVLRHADPGQRARGQRGRSTACYRDRLRRRHRPRRADPRLRPRLPEEIKLMLNLTHPRYVMPIHGDYKRLRLHGQLAEAVGVPRENIFRSRTACRSRSTSAAPASASARQPA